MSEQTSQEFGRYLAASRARTGLSQKDLAARLGISTSYLSLIERGRKRPSPGIVMRLGEVLGGDQDYWLDLAGYEMPQVAYGSDDRAGRGADGSRLRVVGHISGDSSTYYGDSGPREEFESNLVRVMDGSFRAFGYRTGDFLMVDKIQPQPGDMVIVRHGDKALSLRMYDSSISPEPIVGKVTGLIRLFKKMTTFTLLPESEIGERVDAEDLRKILSDLASVLGRLKGKA